MIAADAEPRDVRAGSMRGAFVDRRVWWLATLLVLGCGAIYLPSLEFDFVAFDDDHNIVFNPHLGPLSLERVTWAFTDWEYMRRYLPLGWLGLLGLFTTSGLDPAGYHLAAILLHAANSLLVFAVLRRFLRRFGRAKREPWSDIAAFAGAALWAWHPLRVETVAWTSGLLYGQAIIFVFAALWFHLGSNTWKTKLAELGCIVASLLTYPIALGLWPVLMALDIQHVGWRVALRRNAGAAIVTLAVLGATLWARALAVSVFPALPAWESFPLWQRGLQALAVWGHYLWRPWWPTGFSPVDPFLAEIDTPDVRVAACALLALAVVVAVASAPVLRRRFGLWLAAYGCALVPVLGLTEKPHFASDRYSFLVHALMAAAVALAGERLATSRARRLAMIAGGGLLALFAFASLRQIGVWRNSVALWQHIDARLNPAQLPWLKYARRALFLYESGDLPGALARVEDGLRKFPDSQLLRSSRAEILDSDRRARAFAQQLGLATTPPRNAVLHHSVALRCLRRGDREAAAWHFVEVQRLAPDYFAAIMRPNAPADVP